MIEQADEKRTERTSVSLLKKLRSKRAYSMVEMLCVIAILSILGSAMTTGMSVASMSYANSIRGTEKDVLYSTLEYIISYELRNTTSIQIAEDGQVLDIQALSYGKDEYSDPNGKRMFFGKTVEGENRTMIAFGLNNGNNSDSSLILSKSAYPKELGADVSITYNNSTHYFKVNLVIYYKSSPILSQSFDVLNLYKTNAEVLKTK